jgi:DNA-binding LytR/AlgR family response regulator
MIRIAVCDDDVNIIDYLQKYLDGIKTQSHESKLDITPFRSGEDFLQAIEQGAVFHIVLMDIQMDKMSGVEVGQALREQPNGDDIILIYISSHDSYFGDLVQLGSFRFIGKPIDEKELDEVFSRALRQAVKYKNAVTSPNLFHFKLGSEQYSIRTDEIAFMRNLKRTITLFTWDKAESAISTTYKFYSTIESVMEQLLDEGFIRCERSHIVNLSIIHRLEKDSFVLLDDKNTRIPIGKVYKLETKDAYFKHLEGPR